MDVVLPYRIKNEIKFFDYAFKLGFDEMSVHKFLYMFHNFDVDAFPKMGDDRLNILIYGWVLCDEYQHSLVGDEWELPDEIEFMLKILVPWSLDVWFSKEWERCKPLLRHGLIHCLNNARKTLMRSPDMMQLNWEFLLLYNQTPWQVAYLKSLNVKKEKTLETGGQTIEMEEMAATSEDLQYIKLEQFPLIVLRMVKLFDQGSIDMVKTLCMRVLSAWNKIYHTDLQTAGSRLPYVPPEDKRCLLLICHIYLMAVYEADDVKGYVIDNMINNIRFYYQYFQTNTATYAIDNLGYTPARFIALTAAHLRLQKRELFDFYIWNCAESSPVNLFGVVAQAYKSYLLGNLLMELNNMNEESLASNAALYKRLINAYVNEREKSELFVIGEIKKQEAQRYAHNIEYPVYITDFKSKICKGNRMGNICNYESVDDVVRPREYEKDKKEAKTSDEDVAEDDDEVSVKQTGNELSVDPIFQNIPNNEEILYYVYEVLSKKTYRGWQFAKIVLLFKIISHELNMLETWRYHPGLTINFMLHLEAKLSKHYIDLARIFKDYPFMEQEFWLTAFYLNPTQQSYEAVKRLGIRNNRKRNEEPLICSPGKETIETKFGLLSSTIDVKEIVTLTNSDDQNADYMPLTKALNSLRLPDSVIKDILTVIFLPRNRSFSWAVEWNDLRRRCKMLMTNMSEKSRFVELTMAEANDRLKFLNINYDKYKNRPQLDYGSIEQGYENENVSGDIDVPSDNSDEEEEDFEDDEDVYEGKKTSRSHNKQDIFEPEADENSEEDDPYLVGKRRTRARTAAAMASLLSSSEMTTRLKRKLLEEEMRENEEKSSDNEEKSNDSKSTEAVVPPPLDNVAFDETPSTSTSETPEIKKRNIKECLKEKPLILNTTDGFRPLIDMWNVEKSEFQSIDKTCVSLLESSQILNRFAKLKSINKQINPTSTTEDEQIDEVEMVITHGILGSVAEEEFEGNHQMTEIHANSAKDTEESCATNGKMIVAICNINPTSTTVDEQIDEVEMVIKHGILRSEAEEEFKGNHQMTEIHADSAKDIEESCATNDSADQRETQQLLGIQDEGSKENTAQNKMEELRENTSEVENAELSREINQMDLDLEINQNISKHADPEITTETPPNIIESSTEDQTMNELQQSPREIVSPNDTVKGVKSDHIITTSVECRRVIETRAVCTSLADLKESEEKTMDLALITESSAAIKAEKENTPTTKEVVGSQLSCIEMQESKQECVNIPATIDSVTMAEEVSVVQKCDVVPLLSEEELKDGTRDMTMEKKLLEETLQGSPDNKSIEIATSSCHKNRADDEANPAIDEELKLSIDTEDATHLKDSVDIMPAEDAEINFDLSSLDLSLQFSDDIKSVLQEALNDVISIDTVAEKSSTSLNEKGKTTLDSEEIMETNVNDVDNKLSAKSVPANKTTVKEFPQCSEKMKSIEKETEAEKEKLPKVDLEKTLNEGSTARQECNVEPELSSEVLKSVLYEVVESQAEVGEASLDDNDNDSMHVEDFAGNKCPVNYSEQQKNVEQSNISFKGLEQITNIDESLTVEPLEDIPLELEDKKHTQETTENTIGVSDIDATQVNILPVNIPLESDDNKIEVTIEKYEDINTDAVLQISITHQITSVDDTTSANKPSEDINTDAVPQISITNQITSVDDTTSTNKPFEDINTDAVPQISITHQITSVDDTTSAIKPSEDINTDVAFSVADFISDLDENKIEDNLEDDTSSKGKPSENICTDVELKISGEITFEETPDCNNSVDDATVLNRPLESLNIDVNLKIPDKTTLELKENKIEEIPDHKNSVDDITSVNKPSEAINTIVALNISDKSTFDLGENKSEGTPDHYSSEDDATEPTFKLNQDKFDETTDKKMSTADHVDDKSHIDAELEEKSEETNERTPVEENVSYDLQPLERNQHFADLDITLDKNKDPNDMPSLRWDESIIDMDNTRSQIAGADMPALGSEESKDKPFGQINIENDSNDGPSPEEIEESNKQLKKLLKPLRIILCRLKPSDLVNLRQPIVRVKRCRDIEVGPEDVLPKKRRVRRKFFFDIEGSSDSLSNSSSSSMYRPPRRSMKPALAKRTIPRQNRNSDSEVDSNNSFSAEKKRRTSTPNTQSNHSNISTKSTSRGSTGNSGILVVTPRSASGLKLRISHADQKPTRPKFEPVVVDEVIQVSSSSSDESDTMYSILEVPEDDPLYEEAVIDLHKRR